MASSSPMVTFITGSLRKGSDTAPVSAEHGAKRGKGERIDLTPTSDQLTHQHSQVLCDLCSHNTHSVCDLCLCNTTASPPTPEAGSKKVASGLRNPRQQAARGQCGSKSHTATESSLEPELTVTPYDSVCLQKRKGQSGEPAWRGSARLAPRWLQKVKEED